MHVGMWGLAAIVIADTGLFLNVFGEGIVHWPTHVRAALGAPSGEGYE